MATKRAKALTAAVSKEMEERGLIEKTDHKEATGDHVGLQKVHKRPQKTTVAKVRIPDVDMLALEEIAEAEGSNVSVLIRKAVKELLRRQGAGLR